MASPSQSDYIHPDFTQIACLIPHAWNSQCFLVFGTGPGRELGEDSRSGERDGSDQDCTHLRLLSGLHLNRDQFRDRGVLIFRLCGRKRFPGVS